MKSVGNKTNIYQSWANFNQIESVVRSECRRCDWHVVELQTWCHQIACWFLFSSLLSSEQALHLLSYPMSRCCTLKVNNEQTVLNRTYLWREEMIDITAKLEPTKFTILILPSFLPSIAIILQVVRLNDTKLHSWGESKLVSLIFSLQHRSNGPNIGSVSLSESSNVGYWSIMYLCKNIMACCFRCRCCYCCCGTE